MLKPAAEPFVVRLIRDAAQLDRTDLLELQNAIAQMVGPAPRDNLIKLDEYRTPAPPAPQPTKPGSGGWIENQYKTINGKKYGPYRYYRYWDGSIKRSKYLGKPSPE